MAPGALKYNPCEKYEYVEKKIGFFGKFNVFRKPKYVYTLIELGTINIRR